jgi:excisionase family DNA binding protein
MKPTRLQFDTRENTASSGQYASRLERLSLPSGDSLTDRPLTAATAGRGEGNAEGFQPPLIPAGMSKFTHAFEPLVGCGEAAKLLGNIHVKTLQRYARRGDIPGYQIGGHWYFRASGLDSWLRFSDKFILPSVPLERGGKVNVQADTVSVRMC